MEDAVRYKCDASFGHPSSLVFEGLLYMKTLTPATFFAEGTLTRVVPSGRYGRYQRDGGEEGEDPTAGGSSDGLVVQREEEGEAPTAGGSPKELVVFHRFVYARSHMDPGTIDDDILRTVALFEGVLQIQAPATQSHASVQVAPQQSNRAHRYTRVMPQRARDTQADALELLFDLRAEERAGVTIYTPSYNNVNAPTSPGMIPVPANGRTNWKDEQVGYLYELIELAMLQMNRPLEHADFPAITEAFHRHFRAIGGIPDRGWNTVHSFATRKPEYHRLVQRVLPDVNFPDFVQKPRNRQQ